MTEEEAKTKVCCGPPSLTVAMLAVVNIIRPTDAASIRAGMCCSGSACAAWRATESILRPDPTPVGDQPAYVATGFCDLAGAPR